MYMKLQAKKVSVWNICYCVSFKDTMDHFSHAFQLLLNRSVLMSVKGLYIQAFKNIILCVVSLYIHGDWVDINIYSMQMILLFSKEA